MAKAKAKGKDTDLIKMKTRINKEVELMKSLRDSGNLSPLALAQTKALLKSLKQLRKEM